MPRMYVSISTAGNEIDEITLNEEGEINVFVAKNGSVTSMPYFSMDMEFFDEFVHQVNQLRQPGANQEG